MKFCNLIKEGADLNAIPHILFHAYTVIFFKTKLDNTLTFLSSVNLTKKLFNIKLCWLRHFLKKVLAYIIFFSIYHILSVLAYSYPNTSRIFLLKITDWLHGNILTYLILSSDCSLCIVLERSSFCDENSQHL